MHQGVVPVMRRPGPRHGHRGIGRSPLWRRGGLSDKSFGPSRGAEPESKNLVDAAQPLIEALGFSLLRVFAVDVTQCPRCGSSLRILSVITQPDVIEGIRRHLDLPTAPPSSSRAPPAQVDLQ